MSKLTTTNQVYWELVDSGVDPEAIRQIFESRGWRIPSYRRRTGKPTEQEILEGAVRLSARHEKNAELMQTLVQQYGVPMSVLQSYLRPAKRRQPLP